MNRNSLEGAVVLDGIQAVIFDVDGTLYSLKKMRFLMALDLFTFFVFRPWRWNDLVVLYLFRKNRVALERDSSGNISVTQYELRIRGRRSDPKYVEQLVKEWIFDRPLRYVCVCMYANVARWIRELSKRDIKIAYFSDYPPLEKVKTLKLPGNYFVASSDREVDALKPSPRGLLELVSRMGVPIEQCVFVGDTLEKDGVAAERIGMKFFLLRNGLIG